MTNMYTVTEMLKLVNRKSALGLIPIILNFYQGLFEGV